MGRSVWGDQRARSPKAGHPTEQAAWTRQLVKDDNILLNQLRRQLDENAVAHDADRDVEHLHASEICKPNWCPRASWYKLIGTQPDKTNRRISSLIAAEGNEIHERHQNALAQLGVLTGVWRCLVCEHRWWATSPACCAACGTRLFKYAEVPIVDEDLMLIGHGDGLVETERRGQVLLEVKSIGEGSVRIEAPALYQRLLDGDVNYGGLWSSIRRPFPTHVRQAMLYLRALKLRTAVMLYECKWNQQIKEFRVQYREDTIENIVDGARLVRRAIEEDKVVKRPDWAEEYVPECKECNYKSTCWGVADGDVQQDGAEAKAVSVWRRPS